jgi:hypothetical protein
VTGTFQVLFFLDIIEAAPQMGAIPGYCPELFIFLEDDEILFGQKDFILKGP